MIDADWCQCIRHLNEHFDIGAKLYQCGKDQILLVFMTPRRDTETWKASAKALNFLKRLKKSPASLPRIHHDDFPIWASDTSSTVDRHHPLDPGAPPFTHIRDEVAVNGLRGLQELIWRNETYENYLSDLHESKRSGKWLHVAWTLSKFAGLDLGIRMKLERLRYVYRELGYPLPDRLQA